MPGCDEDVARSPRRRWQKFCRLCVRKFKKQKQRDGRRLRSVQSVQEEKGRPRKHAGKDMRRCSNHSKATRSNGRSTNALIAKKKYMVAFAQETSKSQGIVASSFALEMVSWCVRSPTLAPAVARRSGQRRRLDGYGSNTGSLMGNRARQPSG